MRLISRRLAMIMALVASLAICVSLGIAAAPQARADGGSGGCNVLDPSCTVRAGGDGSGANGGGGVEGGGGNTDPCAAYPAAAYGDSPPTVSQACANQMQGRYCNGILADILGGLKYQSVNSLTPAQTAIVNQNLAGNGCPAIVTAATLAEQAFDSITFPHPSGSRSPSEAQGYKGFPFAYVGLWTYYWTNPGTWKTLTATASAAGLTATVTARPTSLSFDPGDGSGTESCAGPGRPWVESDGNSAPTEGACGYEYSKVTGPGYDNPVMSTQTITWQITWAGTGDTGGQIPALSTSTSGQLNVLQIKTVNQ